MFTDKKTVFIGIKSCVDDVEREWESTGEYAADGVKDVPVGAFVSFERVGNNSRIGSVTVTADGRYELRLRREYEFNWYSDKIELHYEDTAGNVYHKIYDNLAELFAKPDIELQAATGN